MAPAASAIVIAGLADISTALAAQAAMGEGAPIPVDGWRGIDAESPHLNIIEGRESLTEGGSVAQGTDLTLFKGTPKGAGFTNNSTDTLAASSGSVCAPGTSDFGAMIFGQGLASGSARNLCGKKQSFSEEGWTIDGRDTSLNVGLENANGDTASLSVTGDFSGRYGAYLRVRQSSSLADLFTNDGSDEDNAIVAGNYSAASRAFSVGDGWGSCAQQTFGLMLWFLGTLPTETHFNNLMAAIWEIES